MPPIERLLFPSLWLLADDYGNLRGNVSWIHSQVFWGDPSTSVDRIREAVARLSRDSLVTLYTVHGQSYLSITNWARHQRVDKPGQPRVPGPGESDKSTNTEENEDSRQSRETHQGHSSESLAALATDLRPPTCTSEKEETLCEPEIFPHPEQPKPRRPDPLNDQLTGKLPGQLPEVVEVHELWKATFGKTRATIGNPNSEYAKMIRDAIRDYGLASCLAVVRQAPKDGMVTGKDDEKGLKHDDLHYILGNKRAFDRLLEASASATVAKPNQLSVSAQVAALKARN
jgi:hypothetical protein